MNARDVLDRADGIFFEGEVVRSWVQQLARRAKGAIKAAESNKYFAEEWAGEYSELSDALAALEETTNRLEIFAAAVARREGK